MHRPERSYFQEFQEFQDFSTNHALTEKVAPPHCLFQEFRTIPRMHIPKHSYFQEFQEFQVLNTNHAPNSWNKQMGSAWCFPIVFAEIWEFLEFLEIGVFRVVHSWNGFKFLE